RPRAGGRGVTGGPTDRERRAAGSSRAGSTLDPYAPARDELEVRVSRELDSVAARTNDADGPAREHGGSAGSGATGTTPAGQTGTPANSSGTGASRTSASGTAGSGANGSAGHGSTGGGSTGTDSTGGSTGRGSTGNGSTGNGSTGNSSTGNGGPSRSAAPAVGDPVGAHPATRAPSPTRRVRARLARRITAQRAAPVKQVLEPLAAIHRELHPSADLAL